MLRTLCWGLDSMYVSSMVWVWFFGSSMLQSVLCLTFFVWVFTTLNLLGNVNFDKSCFTRYLASSCAGFTSTLHMRLFILWLKRMAFTRVSMLGMSTGVSPSFCTRPPLSPQMIMVTLSELVLEVLFRFCFRFCFIVFLSLLNCKFRPCFQKFGILIWIFLL